MKTKAEEKSKQTVGTDPKKSKKKKILRIVGFGFLTIFIVACLGVLGIYVGFMTWAQNAEFRPELLPTATAVPVFLDANGEKIDYKSDNYVNPDSIPEHVKAAFVALEDKRFYSHQGYDVKGIIRAVATNIKAGGTVEGASTITQQLVKNTHLSSEKTLSRKLNEIAIAMKIEKKYTKNQILAMYLSVIYFGGGAYGINEASKTYFGCTPEELTIAQAATLAGILKNPSRYSPKNSISAATERRNLVLDVMKREGYITDEECEKAKHEKMKLVYESEQADANAYVSFYLDRVAEEVCRTLGMTEYELNNSGITVFTALDPELQTILGKQTSDRANYSSDNVGGAAVLVDNSNGEIVAHYNTLGYEISRQGGSVMKPITVYAPALDIGAITLATPVTDEPCDFGGYQPRNFGDIYYGDTTPREAVKKSMNTVAVKVLTYTGTEKALEYGRKFGLALDDEKDGNLALALGATSKGVNPTTIAGAYSAFARGGNYTKPHYVRGIIKGGKRITPQSAATVQAVSPQTAYLMTDCLVDTVKSGTAKSLSTLPFAVASKTGTVQADSETNTDAWNVSYTTVHTLAVWHGGTKMTELGGGHPTLHAAKIWRSVYDGKPAPQNFGMPYDIVKDEIDVYSTRKSGKLTLAVPSTPFRYRKAELFNAAFRGDDKMSAFANPEPVFEIEVKGNSVEIRFDVEPVYHYTLLCSDAFGTSIVSETDGATYCRDFANGNGSQTPESDTESAPIVIKHTPFGMGRQVSYTLQIGITEGDGTVIGTATKSCFPEENGGFENFWTRYFGKNRFAS